MGSLTNSSSNFPPEMPSKQPPITRRVLKAWWFSLVLGMGYLSVFNLWPFLQPTWVFNSAIAVSALLCIGLAIAWTKKYFRTSWEALLHFLVVLDIFLEGALIPVHDSRSFYWCAFAFAVLIVGYRLHLRGRSRATV